MEENVVTPNVEDIENKEAKLNEERLDKVLQEINTLHAAFDNLKTKYDELEKLYSDTYEKLDESKEEKCSLEGQVESWKEKYEEVMEQLAEQENVIPNIIEEKTAARIKELIAEFKLSREVNRHLNVFPLINMDPGVHVERTLDVLRPVYKALLNRVNRCPYCSIGDLINYFQYSHFSYMTARKYVVMKESSYLFVNMNCRIGAADLYKLNPRAIRDLGKFISYLMEKQKEDIWIIKEEDFDLKV